MADVNQLTVIIAGPQGSGKDTQVDLLKSYLTEHDPSRPAVHFDAGSALRKFTEEDGYTQDIVKMSLVRGELQPMFVLAHVMSTFFITSMRGNEHLLVSGFPRSEDQLLLFNSAMKFYKRESPVLLYFTLPEKISLERLLKRGRADDTAESIRARLGWTREQTLPVIEEFQKNPAYTYIEIDATPTIEIIHRDILNKLNLA